MTESTGYDDALGSASEADLLEQDADVVATETRDAPSAPTDGAAEADLLEQSQPVPDAGEDDAPTP
ncbi:hypothetical protein [Cellulomonas marina]|uniref:Uncharacterized protein n=1 Tax=Cellulomonas marina TaxID=988821 RepID=A0A1I0ZB28_9CELL|nr:hypothetical protein [Cellulomonas marina]GIG30626.1 hypothetical protein Cma02nite_32260 [Cellulomonas marina]SFB22959.1 hypothetical protein SAMN05421867_110105 [Cellulomonas marina]